MESSMPPSSDSESEFPPGHYSDAGSEFPPGRRTGIRPGRSTSLWLVVGLPVLLFLFVVIVAVLLYRYYMQKQAAAEVVDPPEEPPEEPPAEDSDISGPSLDDEEV